MCLNETCDPKPSLSVCLYYIWELSVLISGIPVCPKFTIMKNPIFYVLISLGLYSCASTELVRLSVLEPAPVTLPTHIKNIGVVNRSEIAPQNKVVEVVDKVFSLEGKDLDKEGALATIAGLENELTKNNRFTAIKTIDDARLTSLVPGAFPSPLSWDIVQKICRDNHTDALFSLELFDTDSKISYAANPVTVNTPLGKVPGVEHVPISPKSGGAYTTLPVKTYWMTSGMGKFLRQGDQPGKSCRCADRPERSIKAGG